MTTEHDTAAETSWTGTIESGALEPLRFLEGSWHSDGQGPYGPYALQAIAEMRGRWLLLRYEISDPKSGDVFYFSTQVYGFDDDGLVLELFDTAGSFTFRGSVLDDAAGVGFEWRNDDRQEGEDLWKRSEFKHIDGQVHFRYDSMEPVNSNSVDPDELLTFEGVWKPGKRPPHSTGTGT
jgi:hypothetical protein